jgi:hypothetical protein
MTPDLTHFFFLLSISSISSIDVLISRGLVDFMLLDGGAIPNGMNCFAVIGEVVLIGAIALP